MEIRQIYSYLVVPGKHKTPLPVIRHTNVPLTGRLYTMLRYLFERAESDCDTSIRFLPGDGGTQVNEVRNLICSLLQRNDIRRGASLAKRLCEYTTTKSGLGLFFIIIGRHDDQRNGHKLVLSRFPADQGILADETGDSLDVRFVERVFMKNQATYKAALYSGTSLDTGFWRGYAVDKQFSHSPAHSLANYWIRDFLLSDLRTTAAEGTRRFASALMAANRDAENLQQKEEIIAISRLARGMQGAQSMDERLMQLQVSEPVRELIVKYLPRGDLASDRFQLDIQEYDKHIKYRSVSLHNGAIVTALADDFDQCVQRVDMDNNRVRLSIEGVVTDDRLKRTGN